MAFWVYILRCSDGSYYTGQTDALEQRVAQHVAGAIPGCYTFDLRPVTLVYCQEFAMREEALASEVRIKRWSRAKKEALIHSDWEGLRGLAKRRTSRGPSGDSESGSIAAVSIDRDAVASTCAPHHERVGSEPDAMHGTQRSVREEHGIHNPVRGGGASSNTVRGEEAPSNPVRGEEASSSRVRRAEASGNLVAGEVASSNPFTGDEVSRNPVRGEEASRRRLQPAIERPSRTTPPDANAAAIFSSSDLHWMHEALSLADRAEHEFNEIPVGAILVDTNGELLAEGCNRTIGTHDPTAHAEIVALRAAGKKLGNYRLPGTTLYVTLEPCAMCAMALVHARVARVVFSAFDPKTGAAGSVFDLLGSERHNHRVRIDAGLLGEEAGARLTRYFRRKRGKTD